MQCLTMMTKYSMSTSPDLKARCTFMAEYAAWLYGCGATCIRIRKNVLRMAEAWQMKVEITVMPAAVQVCVFDEEGNQALHCSKRIPHTFISFYKNTQLSKLSWAVADGRTSFEDARKRFTEVIEAPGTNQWMVLVLASLANMSFCQIFGGDLIAMGIVLAATLAGYRLKQVLLDDKADVRLTFVLCAFFSSVIGASGFVFHLGTTPETALATSVLYLIPGIPYINSISDMLEGQYIVSFSRFMNSMVLTFCLSVGLSMGILLMNLEMF